jgi:uncharacterized protein
VLPARSAAQGREDRARAHGTVEAGETVATLLKIRYAITTRVRFLGCHLGKPIGWRCVWCSEMTRRDLVLAILAVARGRPYQPAQLQKAAFLIMRNVPHIIEDGPGFSFVPYDYGPFDASVYWEAEKLRDSGEAIITLSPNGRWKTYAASQLGITRGEDLLRALPEEVRAYISRISEWVLSQSFGSLIRAIYDAYPEMRENSIFNG